MKVKMGNKCSVVRALEESWAQCIPMAPMKLQVSQKTFSNFKLMSQTITITKMSSLRNKPPPLTLLSASS